MIDIGRSYVHQVNGGKDIIIAKDPKMLNLLDLVKHLADYSTTVLITGETGTGKELIAKALHTNRKDKETPFYAINCAGMPQYLFESELFGHVKGSFTGAHRDKQGIVRAAENGTLFLDEIGELNLDLQAKILRLLQERVFTRVGAIKEETFNARIVTATNKDLSKEIKSGKFREDLYHRISTINLNIPSLRERPEDIPLIAEHWAKVYAEEYLVETSGFDNEAIEALVNKEWPGNIRQLQNTIERTVLMRGLREKKSGLKKTSPYKLEELVLDEEMPLDNNSIFSVPQIIIPSTKNWFDQGVLPISVGMLNGIRNAYTSETLKKIISRERVPFEMYGTGNKKVILLYITPKNINLLFHDNESEEFDETLNSTTNNLFYNQIVHEPFLLMSKSMIMQHPYTQNNPLRIRTLTEELPISSIPLGRTTLYSINEENAQFFAGNKNQGIEYNVERLISQIKKNYERFKEMA